MGADGKTYTIPARTAPVNTVGRDLANMQKHNRDLPETITDSRGQERPATYRKPEPPRTVNTDTGEIVPSPAHLSTARQHRIVDNSAVVQYILSSPRQDTPICRVDIAVPDTTGKAQQ